MLRLIREEIGFDGLLMTDDISMGALGGSLSGKCRDALAAGCDLVLHCNGDLPEMRLVAETAGRMGEAAAHRADRALRLRRTPQPIDIPAAEAELEALLSGRANGGS
jgi:beta-N-acetylhexosaminidase